MSLPLFIHMFKTLPNQHPPLKNCINQLPPDDMLKLSFDDWEFDDDGLALVVKIQLRLKIEDDIFIEDLAQHCNTRPQELSFRILPLRIQEWVNENIEGDWFYDVATVYKDAQWATSTQLRVYKFHFQRASDAVMFKLTWSSEDE